MRKIIFAAILLIGSTGLYAQDILKTLTVSNTFSTTAGTPRVVRNGFQHVWLVAWRQQGSPSKIVARVVKSDGSMLPFKTLASGVSTADQNFDLAYDSVNYTYLLAFENAAGLQVQLFNGNLAKVGNAALIEGGISGALPRLAFDPVGKKFLIFWLSTKDGISKRTLNSRTLDIHGSPTAAGKLLATSATGKIFSSLSISTNQKNGMLVAMIGQLTSNAGDLVSFLVKSDGSLQKATPNVFQSTTTGLRTAADASFTDAGTGLGFWSDRTAVKFRKVSLSGSFASAPKSLAGFADVNSLQTSILWDSRNNQFIGAWSLANTVRAVVINTATAAIIKQPFAVGTSTIAHSRDVATSYDAQLGNALVIWEDSSVTAPIASQAGATFKIRGAIVFVGGAGSTSAITIGDNFYAPATLSVPAGTTVQWTHNGNNRHTATSPSGVFNSGELSRGQTFSFHFASEGTFPYNCLVHGTAMSGTITVTAGGGEPGPHY